MGGASCFHEGQQGKVHKWRGGWGQVKGADEKMVGVRGGEWSCTDKVLHGLQGKWAEVLFRDAREDCSVRLRGNILGESDAFFAGVFNLLSHHTPSAITAAMFTVLTHLLVFFLSVEQIKQSDKKEDGRRQL
jgi:hypothetical protein